MTNQILNNPLKSLLLPNKPIQPLYPILQHLPRALRNILQLRDVGVQFAVREAGEGGVGGCAEAVNGGEVEGGRGRWFAAAGGVALALLLGGGGWDCFAFCCWCRCTTCCVLLRGGCGGVLWKNEFLLFGGGEDLIEVDGDA